MYAMWHTTNCLVNIYVDGLIIIWRNNCLKINITFNGKSFFFFNVDTLYIIFWSKILKFKKIQKNFKIIKFNNITKLKFKLHKFKIFFFELTSAIKFWIRKCLYIEWRMGNNKCDNKCENDLMGYPCACRHACLYGQMYHMIKTCRTRPNWYVNTYMHTYILLVEIFS